MKREHKRKKTTREGKWGRSQPILFKYDYNMFHIFSFYTILSCLIDFRFILMFDCGHQILCMFVEFEIMFMRFMFSSFDYVYERLVHFIFFVFLYDLSMDSSLNLIIKDQQQLHLQLISCPKLRRNQGLPKLIFYPGVSQFSPITTIQTTPYPIKHTLCNDRVFQTTLEFQV